MKRIALFGGSFNPIHVGHLAIADAVIEQGLADEVWLMVSPHNPLKQQADLAPESTRLKWARLAVEEAHPGVVASDYECHLPRPSYTYLTLRSLREKYPQHEFLLCIGADNWQCFSKWREPEEILAHHKIIIYPREGVSISEPLPENVQMLNCPLVNVSSTEIRQHLTAGESIEGFVPTHLIPTLEEAWKNR